MKQRILILLLMIAMAGCAVNTRFVSYTGARFPAKEKYYFVSVYPESVKLPFTQPYRMIGRVDAAGRASEGVTADSLADEAKNIARAKGADAVINVRTESVRLDGVNVIPGRCRRHYCYPDEYVPYSDLLLRFRGELIAFTAPEVSDKK